MGILLFVALYGYSIFRSTKQDQSLFIEEYSEVKLAWQLRSMFFYEPWLIELHKKGFLLSLKDNCRRIKLDGVMSSRQCAVVLLIFYTFMLTGCTEGIVYLLKGSWNPLIFVGCLLVGATVGIKLVEEVFVKIKRVRQRQISQQLPVFLTKLMLNIGAGVSIKAAWEKSLEDCHSGYFYKHGWRVLQHLELNGSLRLALEQMSLQMADHRVERLIKLLVQMRDYGDSGFIGKLESMKLDLWQDRLRTAREMAEEAKVKLLLPLFMTFGGVLLVIMMPILMAMKGVFL